METFLRQVQRYLAALEERRRQGSSAGSCSASTDIGHWIGECRVRLRAIERGPAAAPATTVTPIILRQVVAALSRHRDGILRLDELHSADIARRA